MGLWKPSIETSLNIYDQPSTNLKNYFYEYMVVYSAAKYFKYFTGIIIVKNSFVDLKNIRVEDHVGDKILKRQKASTVSS